MRINTPQFAPMVSRIPVQAGGAGPSLTPVPALQGDTLTLSGPATAPVTPVVPATPATPAATTPPATPTGLSAWAVKAQSFLTNIWDTLLAPLFKNLLGMFGI